MAQCFMHRTAVSCDYFGAKKLDVDMQWYMEQVEVPAFLFSNHSLSDGASPHFPLLYCITESRQAV